MGNSRFATLSKGFPNLVLFRLVQISLLLTAIVSFLIQLTYLSTTTFVLERDLMFIVNLILLATKLALITLEFVYKNHVLRSAPTMLSESNTYSENDVNDVESAKGVNGIVYISNPMMESGSKPDDEENKPLLEKSLKGIRRQLGDLELEMSTVRAETGSMEGKVEGVETKMDNVETKVDNVETKVEGVETKVDNVETKVDSVNEETHLLKSQISALEQEIKSLRNGSIMASSQPYSTP